MMKRMLFVLLAAVPPPAIRAQNAPPNEAGQGARYCGHVMDAGTFVDARARNATGEEAVVIRWLDPKGAAVHSALSMGRCIAQDGETIDGRLIVRVLPNSLAVSVRHGLTAWEAEYWNFGEQAGRGAPHRGVFNEHRFEAELDASKASERGSADPDFRWNEEQETVAIEPRAALAGQTQPSPAAKPCASGTQKGPKVKAEVPEKARVVLCKFGFCVDNTPVALSPPCR
jgi:hypothetical protein